jgi:hypothetical protein
MSTAGAAAAAAAAAAEAMRRQEEEELSMYGERDLTDDWEFKILRSATAAFRNPEKLQEVLAEEAHAGWILVEKFDDQRLRLKRPASARQLDGKLDFDPYRTTVGTSEARVAAFVILGVALFIASMLLLAALLG